MDDTYLYEWVSSRTGMSKEWSVFSTPALWAAAASARGPIPFFRAISGNSWSNSEANTATTGDNVTGDRVTLYNSTAKWTATRVWNGSRWITIGKWIDGNLIVEGSLLSIFDIIAGAAVESANYVAGVDGWRIAQDGDAEFNGSVFAENLQSTRVLYDTSRPPLLGPTGAEKRFALSFGTNEDARNYTGFLITGYPNPSFGFMTVYVDRADIPTRAAQTAPVSTGSASFLYETGSVVIRLRGSFRRSAGTRLYLSMSTGGQFYVKTILGIKGSSLSVVTPSPTITTDTDTIYRRSTSTPSTPSGGTTQRTHTPSGWSRTQPSATTTQGVYSATRTRTSTNGTFTSATSWGSVTLIQAPSGAALTLPDPSNFNAPQGSTTEVTLPAATGGTGNYTYSISGALSSTGAVFTPSSRLLRVTPITNANRDAITYTVNDGVNSVSQSFVITRTAPALTAPGTPGVPTLTSSTTTSLVLACSAPTTGGAPVRYRWRISTNSAVTDSDTILTSVGPSISVTGLTAGTSYWVDVRAENAVGNSAYTGNFATSTGVSSPTITTNTDTIYRRATSTPSTPSGGTSTRTHTPSGWSRSEPSPTTTQGVYSSNRTRTYSNGTFTSATAWATPVRIAPPSQTSVTTPGRPGTPTVTRRTDTSLVLACTAPTTGSSPTSYKWRISTNSTVNNSDPSHTSVGPSITIANLSSNTNYWVDVIAINSAGSSLDSGNLATSTRSAAVSLTAPVLTVTKTVIQTGKDSSTNQATLTWTTVTGATGYQYRSIIPADRPGETATTSAWANVAASPLVLTSAFSNIQYQVRAIKSGVAGPVSNIAD